MASYAIHLAISEVYLKKHSNENYEKFIDGTIDVDDAEDKIKSHYTGSIDKINLKAFLCQKVILSDYVKFNSIDTSYDRGCFLHLLTDYYFYNAFLDEAWINNVEYSEFKNVLYHDYNILNGYLKQKYSLEIPSRLKANYLDIHDGKLEVLTLETIDKFIAFMSELDIYKIYNMIKESENILFEYDNYIKDH